jgi:orotate phosphoribosyltransferase
MLSEEEVKSKPKEKLLSLIRKLGAHDKETGFVNLDLLWASPIYLKEAADVVENYLRSCQNVDTATKIVGLNASARPFGIIPILPLVSVNLGLQLLIWKEGAVRLTGQSLTFPENKTQAGGKVVIIQDVTAGGMAPIKASVSLSEQGYKLLFVLTLVDMERGAADYIKKSVKELTNQDIEFKAILTLRELTESIS